MAADPAWVTELSADNPRGGAGNDLMRTTGDFGGILSKYNANTGPSGWSDAPQGEFIDLANAANLTPDFDWLAGLTNGEMNAFRGTHTVDGMVTLSIAGTRTALTSSTGWTAEMTTAVTAQYQTVTETLYESLGLANVGKSGLYEALREIPDSYWAIQDERNIALDSIKAKTADDTWRQTTSVANLQTIDSLIGV